MANAPDRYERFMVQEGMLKIDFEKDTRLPNAGTFVIQREDHTVGNLMKMQLHKDPDVTFAGYRIPHPLEYRMLIKLSTNGAKSPVVAGKEAITALKYKIGNLNQQFSREAARFPGA